MAQRLTKSRKSRVLFGVAGGLGEYFDVDPVLVRVAFVSATLLTGIGLIAYALLAILAPSEARTSGE